MSTYADPPGSIKGWGAHIADAQREPTLVVAGKTFKRVLYGNDFPDGPDRCRDCAVERGRYHVLGCCVERCPRCKGGQAISCLCRDFG